MKKKKKQQLTETVYRDAQNTAWQAILVYKKDKDEGLGQNHGVILMDSYQCYYVYFRKVY